MQISDSHVEKVCYNCCLPWTQNQLQGLVSGYVAGKSIRVVADLAGVSFTAARRALRILEVPVRPDNITKSRSKNCG